jgi:hypothetical protein
LTYLSLNPSPRREGLKESGITTFLTPLLSWEKGKGDEVDFERGI